jgi:hypothetical protein
VYVVYVWLYAARRLRVWLLSPLLRVFLTPLPLPLPGFARPFSCGCVSLAGLRAPALPRGSLRLIAGDGLPVVLRQLLLLRLSANTRSASAASPPLPSPLPDRTPLSAFASSRSPRGQRGSLVQLHHLRGGGTNSGAVGTASAVGSISAAGAPHRADGAAAASYPDHAGADGAAASSCARSSSANGLPPPVFVLPPPSPSVLAILSFLRLLAVSVPDILVLVRFFSGFP